MYTYTEMVVALEIRDMACCACKEIHGISPGFTHYENPKVVVDYVRHYFERPSQTRRPYFIFTEANSGNYGHRLADYIREKKLGFVHSTGPNINPNTGNLVEVFIWTLDFQKLMRKPRNVAKTRR